MKLNIGQKIVLFGLLPSIATIFFIYTIITEKMQVKAGADRIVKLSQYVVNASGLVHELQKEQRKWLALNGQICAVLQRQIKRLIHAV